MSITDEDFFNENIVKVNKRVQVIIAATFIVPIVFFILSHIGIWIVPNWYCFTLFSLTSLFILSFVFLNHKKKTQVIAMYIGVLYVVIFDSFLGFYNIIILTITYGFAPIITCLYYNRKLTLITLFANYFAIFCAFLFKAQFSDVNSIKYFVDSISGFSVEYLFLAIITNAVVRRSEGTLRQLMVTADDRNRAFDKLKERNQYIIKINNEIEGKNRELERTQYKIIEFVAKVLGSHDLFTGMHVNHTRKYVEIIAKELRDEGYYVEELTDKNISLFETAAFLHDIGKVHIPEGVLNKTGKFTPDEFDLMKCHPEEGKKLLEYLPQIDDGKFNEIAKQMAYTHHEKWDGTGYPNGLSAYDIPLCGRIMAAADVLDALISQRLYKEAMSLDEAMEVFRKSSGMHFEPCIATAVINCKNLIAIIDKDFKTAEASTNAEELEWWLRYHASLAKKERKSPASNFVEKD